MAIYSKGILRGVLGPTVCREMNGKQVVSRRLAKGEMKQTQATKKMAGVFGKASMLGKQIRETVKQSLNKLYDPAMSRRLTTNLRGVLSLCRDPKTEQYSFYKESFSQLNGFDYNLKSPLNKNLIKTIIPTISDGILSIDLPASKPLDLLLFPAGSSVCDVSLEISLFRLNDGIKKYAAKSQVLTIEKNAAGIDQQHFEFTVPDGCLCVVSVFLKFYDRFRGLATVMNSKTFSPAGICAVLITPGLYDESDKKGWVRMPNLKFDVKIIPEGKILVVPNDVKKYPRNSCRPIQIH